MPSCSNVSNRNKGVFIHRSPSNGATYVKWVHFVQMHKANFYLQGTFVVCLEHFSPDCFQRIHMPNSIPTIWKASSQKPQLIEGDWLG